MSSHELIHIKDIKKTYRTGDVTVEAVRGVTLRVNEGEFIALMGPSGSGKSTLMNLLAFLDAPTAGSYEFAGRNISSFDNDYLAELRNATIGFVFQQFHLLPRTSALDNVRLPLLYARTPRNKQLQQARGALEKVGLLDRIDHKPNELSGGQQQRVSIARALVNEPRIIFCDEPTGNLDSKTAHEIMQLFKKLHEEGRTIIMVTHEDDIAAYARRVIHLKDGKIIRGSQTV